jgi:hypothetical protein
MNKLKTRIKSHSGKEIFTASLALIFPILMVICVVARLTGSLWFQADWGNVPIPSLFWQQFILCIVNLVQLSFQYKILCNTKWKWCILIAAIQTAIMYFVPQGMGQTMFNLSCMVVIPVIVRRQLRAIVEGILFAVVMTLYSLMFIYGRLGENDVMSANYNFVYGMVASLDYYLFVVSIYAVRKYIGGSKMSHKSLNNTEEKKPIEEHGGWPNSPFGIFGNEQSADADLKNKFDIVDEENQDNK